MIDDVIAANPAQVEQYRKGKKTVAAFFVGQVMKASKGQANPALLNELVSEEARRLAIGFVSGLINTPDSCFCIRAY